MLSKPVAPQQAAQARHNKGVEGSLACSISLALGEGLSVCGEILGAYSSKEHIVAMCFNMTLTELGGACLSKDEVDIILQEGSEYIELAVAFGVGLAGKRAAAMMQDI